MRYLIRADGDVRMGTGHVMRCLALAQAMQERGATALFASACIPESIAARLEGEGIAVVRVGSKPGGDDDARQTAAAARAAGAAWVVLDGYQFPGGFQKSLRDEGLKVLTIDDTGDAEHYWADLVLNQNLHARADMYQRRESHTRLLLGPRYALLRREFWRWRGFERVVPAIARKVLVTLGGFDPDGVTLKVVAALDRLDTPGLEAVVVTGAGSHRAALEEAARTCRTPTRLRSNVADMSELMAWADLAVAAGGSTTWERALLGLPSVIIVLADNQQDVAESAAQARIAWDLGDHARITPAVIADAVRRLLEDLPARTEMARRGPQLVDGRGAERVVTRLGRERVQLRRAKSEDCRLLWEWANERGVRAVSFSTDPIPWDSHRTWYEAKLNDPRCLFFIAVAPDGQAVGQVRCDLDGPGALVSISLDPRFRGLGYGSAALDQVTQELFARGDVQELRAYIRAGNEASRHAFVAAGFAELEQTVVQGHPASQFICRRCSA
jgi:UDP-2,4-diacetamido-2,4,6-trideoxy-beta-L-altropyranose hydrolase